MLLMLMFSPIFSLRWRAATPLRCRHADAAFSALYAPRLRATSFGHAACRQRLCHVVLSPAAADFRRFTLLRR